MNSSAGSLDFLENPLELVELILQFVDPDADVGEPEVDVLVRGDRYVAEAPVLVGEADMTTGTLPMASQTQVQQRVQARMERQKTAAARSRA